MKLKSLGFIQRSTPSMYASAAVVVRKKDVEGNYTDFRQCGDYGPLNLETTLDRYPLPGIEDIFNQIGGATIFSKLEEHVSLDTSTRGGPLQDNLLGS